MSAGARRTLKKAFDVVSAQVEELALSKWSEWLLALFCGRYRQARCLPPAQASHIAQSHTPWPAVWHSERSRRAWPPPADAPPPCAYFKTTASNRGWPADDLVHAPPPAHVDGNDIPADAAWHPRRWSYLDAAPDRRAPLFVREPEGEARVVPL